VAVNDDAGALFFFGREFAVMVGVEEAQNFLMGSFAAMVLKNFHVNLSVFLAEALSELDAAVDGIGVANETADEPNDDRRRWIVRGRVAGRYDSRKVREGE
jgi:hypothetical protein